MINRLIIFLFYSFLVIAASANAKPTTNLDQLIQEQVKNSNAGDLNLGVYIENLETGKEKFSLHANRFFIPASVTKIFNAYAALKYLGAEYRIPTSFISEKNLIKDKQLHSDLYIKFQGDPAFTYAQLVDSFKALGIHAIYGNVVIDDSFLDDNNTSPGGFTWDDKPFYYAAPKSAVIIDKNTSEAWVKPSDKIGEVAKLKIDCPNVLNIVNNVETVKSRNSECPFKSRYIGPNIYEVYGCMFNDVQEIRLNFSLQDTQLMAKQYVTQAIKDAGIALHGNVAIGKTKDGKLIYQNLSVPIKDLLTDILSDSCNLTSGVIFKHMAAISTGKRGSDEDGEILMKNVLEKNGISSKLFFLRDGSGESRYNLVTPKAVVQLLKLVYNDNKIRSDFIDSLPQYGSDGTLRYRSLDGSLGKFVYAKTGTFRSVSALAGYYLPDTGQKYVFAIMSNNSRLSWSEAKSLEDKILSILLSK